MTVTLIPVRELDGAPVIVAPYGARYWHTTKRLRHCEIWTLPEVPNGDLREFCWWMPLFRRDVTLWPIDAYSGVVFGTFLEAFRTWTPRQQSTFDTLRIAWGHPFAEELGEPPAVVEMVYRRGAERQQRAA